MDRTELGKITRIRTGKLDANAADDGGMYPFFTCAEKPLAINTAAYDCECVLVAGNGDLNVKYYKGKFNAYQRTYIVESSDSAQLQVPYLYRFLEHYVHNLRSQSIGGVIKYIRLSNLTDALIPLLSTAEQQQVADCFDKIDELVSVCQRALDSLDLLVKSRFIEMFSSDGKYPLMELKDLCRSIRNGANIKQDKTKSGYPITRIETISNGVFNEDRLGYGDIFNIERYSSYILHSGDLLISHINSLKHLGKAVRFRGSDKVIIHGMNLVRIEPNDLADSAYLEVALQMPDVITYIQRHAKKSVNQASISISDLRKMPIRLPPIWEQKAFANFTVMVDKLRFDVQQQIEKLETLKKSLMQEYFG